MPAVNDIAIDLGTSNVLVYMVGKGIVLREPAVVAMDRETHRPKAVGADAYRMIGRTPSSITAVRPLRQGTMTDFEMTSQMLRTFVASVVGRHLFARPHAVMSVPTGINDVEKRQLISVLIDAGMRRTQLLDKSIAAALGIGLDINAAYGSMVVDMGAGVTDIAVIASGEVGVAACVPIGGDAFDDAIIRYLRKKDNLLVGERTAEEIKINIGTAVAPVSPLSMEVTGRNLISGLPKTQTVTSDEVYEAVREPVGQLIEAIQSVIERTPPQLASDIFNRGIAFTGGAAALGGLAEAVYRSLNIPCGIADDPQTCVVMGCGRALEDPSLRGYLQGERRSFRRL